MKAARLNDKSSLPFCPLISKHSSRLLLAYSSTSISASSSTRSHSPLTDLILSTHSATSAYLASTSSLSRLRTPSTCRLTCSSRVLTTSRTHSYQPVTDSRFFSVYLSISKECLSSSSDRARRRVSVRRAKESSSER